MLGSLGFPEIAIIVVVVLLLFGPSQLPKLGRSVGDTIKEFRKIGKDVAEAKDDIEVSVKKATRDLRS